MGRERGEERKTSNGYVTVYYPDHPRANAIGEVPKHTLVLEAELGRYLTSNEVAHHINHVRDDNRPENLRLMDVKEHTLMHIREALEKRRETRGPLEKKAGPPKKTASAPRPWSQGEEAFLREQWRLDDKEIAARLGRTKAAVRGHRMKMGLGGKPGKRGSPWLPQQEKYLRDVWGSRTIPEIAEFLGRTVTAVKNKAKRLGLRDQMRSGELMTARAVAELLGVDGHTVRDHWVVRYGLDGWTLPRGDGERETMVIRRSDLRRWLRKNREKWDSRRLKIGGLWKKEPPWLEKKRAADALLPPRRFAKWGPEEDALLLKLMERGGMTYRQMGEALGRSDKSVIQRARRLGAEGLRKRRRGHGEE